MSINKIIQESISENPVGLKEALQEELRARLALVLEAKIKEADCGCDDEDDLDEASAQVKKAEMLAKMRASTHKTQSKDAIPPQTDPSHVWCPKCKKWVYRCYHMGD